MFRHRGRFSACTMEVDIHRPNQALQGLPASNGIISITHVFHQLGWDDQIVAAKQLSAGTHPGGMVVGFQVSTVREDYIRTADLSKLDCYWHNPGTLGV